MESESANNQIQNNDGDEIGVYSSSLLYAGGSESDGNSNIVDGSDYIINNSTAYTVLAENNWWGTSSPTSGLFNGMVDYNPYLGSAVSFRVGGSELSLKGRIVAAQQRILMGKGIPTGKDVANLYVLQGADRFDAYGLRASTFEVITSLWKAYLSSNEGERTQLRDASERAILIEIREALANGRLTEASKLTDLYGAEGTPENQVEFLILKAGLYQQQKRYSDAQGTIEALGPLVDGRLSFALENIVYDSRMTASSGGGSYLQELEAATDDIFSREEIEEAEFDVAQDDREGRTRLEVAYPNPFNPQTTIPFELAESAQVKIVVHDILGRQVAVLVNSTLDIGRHHTSFDASKLPSGVYFIRARFTMSSGDMKQFSERIVLQK